MASLQKLQRRMAKRQQGLEVSFRKVRYQGTVLGINPRINHKGLNSAYLQTRAIQDAVELWEVYLDKSVLSDAGIGSDALLTGKDWQISEDNGATWIDAYVYQIPKQQSFRWIANFARGITSANLTVTYEVGLGTFQVIDGNPVEDTQSQVFTSTVSQDRARTQQERAPGISPSRIFLQGHFVNPQTQPADLQTMRPWPATLTTILSDGSEGIAIDGFFLALNMAQDAWSNRQDERGDRIMGYFSTSGG